MKGVPGKHHSLWLCSSAVVHGSACNGFSTVSTEFSSGLSSYQLLLPMRLLMLLKASFAEAARWLTIKTGTCVFLGRLMLTRSFDQRVGRGRGSRVILTLVAVPSHENPLYQCGRVCRCGAGRRTVQGLQRGNEEKVLPQRLWERLPQLGWPGTELKASYAASERGLLAVQKAEALKAPCDVWLSGWCCLCSKDQRPAQLQTQQQQV